MNAKDLIQEAPPDVKYLYGILASRLKELYAQVDFYEQPVSALNKLVQQDEVLAPYVRVQQGASADAVRGAFTGRTRQIILMCNPLPWGRHDDLDNMLSTLRHELAHLYQNQYSPRQIRYRPKMQRLGRKVDALRQAEKPSSKWLGAVTPSTRQRMAKEAEYGKAYLEDPLETQAYAVQGAGKVRELPSAEAKNLLRAGGPYAARYREVNPKAFKRHMKDLYLSTQQEARAVVAVMLDS